MSIALTRRQASKARLRSWSVPCFTSSGRSLVGPGGMGFNIFREQRIHKERQVASENNVRCQSNDAPGRTPIDQITAEYLECHLALREWALVKRGEDVAGLNQILHLREKVGCNYLNLAKTATLVERSHDWHAVCCIDVDPTQVGIARKQLECGSVRVLRRFVGLDRGK